MDVEFWTEVVGVVVAADEFEVFLTNEVFPDDEKFVEELFDELAIDELLSEVV